MASSRSDRPTSAPTTGARTGDGPPAGGTRPGRSPDRTTGDRIDPTDAALRAIAVEAGVDDPARLDRRDTHLSIVLLTPDRAYKVKRARRLAFADHTDPAVRRGACETEIAVNRDLAPDVYLGVRSVVPDGDGFRLGDGDDPAAVEHVVEMARFDEATSLAAAVGAGGAGGAGGPDPDDLRRVATTIAAFHARATPTVRDEDDRAAAARAIERLATEDAELTALLDDPADRATLHAVQRRLRTFVRDRADVLGSRARGGLVRDGHGDLRAEHVLLGDPVRIVDRIEFRDDLRRVDVADDLAFLVMDLAASGAPDAADVLLAAYRDAGGDAGDDALVAFFAARWALVRAKVARLRERDDPAARAADLRESARMLATAERFAWRTLAPLVLVVSGPSGSGKSVLAAEIARRSGLEVCSSDVVRKERAGLDPTARGGEELYGPGTGPATYAELGRRARAVLERAPGVIVDATGLRRVDREALAGALGDRWGDALHVACTAPRAVLQERLERRLSEPGRVSDAGPEVGLAQVVEPLDEVPADRLLPTRTDRPVDRIVAAVTAALDA